jgi:polyphosphate glucokinase
MMNDFTKTLGIDVGGSSIKLGNVSNGLVTDYKSFEVPVVTTPNNVFAYIRSNMPNNVSDVIGIGMPCVVQNGLMKTTANIDDSWQNCNPGLLGNQMLGKHCVFINDCDAAALAEVRYGAARNVDGTVIVVTLGTGIGTALFHNGVLFPNTELGHINLFGITSDAERYAAAKVKTNLSLDWYQYVERVNVYLNELHRLLWPSAFVIGGGVSNNFEQWGSLLKVPCDVYPATLGNNAGIVGAALYASEYI